MPCCRKFALCCRHLCRRRDLHQRRRAAAAPQLDDRALLTEWKPAYTGGFAAGVAGGRSASCWGARRRGRPAIGAGCWRVLIVATALHAIAIGPTNNTLMYCAEADRKRKLIEQGAAAGGAPRSGASSSPATGLAGLILTLTRGGASRCRGRGELPLGLFVPQFLS